MEELDVFFEFNEQVFKAQREHELQGMYNLEIDGETTASFIADVFFRRKNIHPLPYSPLKIHDEFWFISQDIIYATGVLYFLRPFIENTKVSTDRYNKYLPGKRYLLYATFGFQSVYNFWERIGYILYLFFPTGLRNDAVYFNTVMSCLPNEYKNHDYYIELNNLFEQVRSLLEIRDDSFYNFQIEVKHYWGDCDFINNKEKREKLNAEKSTYPDRLKEALKISIQAFVVAVRFINTLPDKNKDLTSDNKYT